MTSNQDVLPTAEAHVHHGRVETSDSATIHLQVRPIAAVGAHDGGLVSVGLRIPRRTTERFRPVGREPLGVLRMEPVAERVSDHLVGHDPRMPSVGQTQQSVGPSRGLVHRHHRRRMAVLGPSLMTGARRVRCGALPAWNAIEQGEPEFAGRVRRLFDAGRHKTIATLRADGSPRISGIECEFTDGELRFGSMTGARKLADLERDPRFALHGPTFHPEDGKESDWPGEAKIAGRAIPVSPVLTDASDPPDGEMFVADIAEVVITGLDSSATKLVVESWTPERGLRRIERD